MHLFHALGLTQLAHFLQVALARNEPKSRKFVAGAKVLAFIASPNSVLLEGLILRVSRI